MIPVNLVIATHNPDKIVEFRRILAPLGVKAEAAAFPEPEETGTTFEENAHIKAEAACRATGLPAVADDSGLAVEALGGAPGVYSARYAGPDAGDEDRVRKVLEELNSVPMEKRDAKFVCSICCVFPNGDSITADGECRGKIAFAPKGNGGFGYDPVFLVGKRTFAEFGPEEKDAVSHRGRALRGFAERFKTYTEAKGWPHKC